MIKTPKAKERTQLPVVLVHGLFGYGEERPFFGFSPPYFPLRQVKQEWAGPVVAVDLGMLSSDHDRACELFAQLRGALTDYGEEHAATCGHERFGDDYTGRGRLPWWDQDHPVHLIGHSFGGNTSLTLLNLLATDFWGIGTNTRWIASITTICSPMHGCSLPFAYGLREPRIPGSANVRPFSFVHCLCMFGGIMLFVQLRFPFCRWPINFQMPQWRTRVNIGDVCAMTNKQWQFWVSGDNMLSEATPQCCRGRLCTSLENLANVKLIAVIADSVPPISWATTVRYFKEYGAVILATILLFKAISRYWLRRRARLYRLGVLGCCALVVSGIGSLFAKNRHAYLYSLFLRPMVNVNSYALAAAASKLCTRSGLIVGGGDICGNDGFVDLWSQNALDVPTIPTTRRLPSPWAKKIAGSSQVVSEMAKGFAMSRTYSDQPSDTAMGARQERPLEPGKWRVFRVPDSDHALGTILSPYTIATYSAVLKLLAQ